MVLSMLASPQNDAALDGPERDRLINEVIDQINAPFGHAARGAVKNNRRQAKRTLRLGQVGGQGRAGGALS